MPNVRDPNQLVYRLVNKDGEYMHDDVAGYKPYYETRLEALHYAYLRNYNEKRAVDMGIRSVSDLGNWCVVAVTATSVMVKEAV